MRALFRRFSAFSAAVLFAVAASAPATHAQTAKAVAASGRITAPVDSGVTAILPHTVPDYAAFTALPSVALASETQFDGLTLILSRAPQVEAAWQQFLADQLNPASPSFHHWLTPAEVGTLYGPAQSDIDAAVNWLQSQGLTVSGVSPSRVLITFSGTAQTVSNAFRAPFRTFSLANGETRYSITQDPSIPAALTPVVLTVAGLSQAIHRPTMHRSPLVAPKSGASLTDPAYTSTTSGRHYLLASDFNAVFGVNTAASAGYNGGTQRIAVIGLSRVNASDISTLQTLSGQGIQQPKVVIPTTGNDPGTPGDANPSVDSGAQDEATLDIDRTFGTSPGAAVDLVVSGNVGTGNTFATDGLYIAINYNINTLIDPIMSISFGGCEALNGQSVDTYEDQIFTQAAAEGITTFISSGDSSAAACNAFYSTIPNPQTLSINDICASAAVTCVGGTEFADTASPSTYWNSTNSGANGKSIISYIPEGVWNDVTAPSGTTTTYSYGGSGGGASVYIAKPSWQVGVGVLAGTFRLIPDVAYPSSVHDGFVGCLNYAGGTCAGTSSSFTNFFSFGGTSAAAPTMAAVQAIANQRLGGKQGNINPKIYQLAATTSNNVFHDATPASSGVTACALTTPSMCNNSTPSSTSLTGGLSGYALTTGWDAATGWGTIDANNYITAISTPTVASATALTVVPATITTAQTTTLTATVTGTGGTPSGLVQFQANGVNVGAAVTLSTGGVATLANQTFGGPAVYAITAVYKGDNTFLTSTSPAVTLTVNPATAATTTVLAANPTSITSTQTSTLTATVSSTTAGSIAGTVQFSVNGVAKGAPVTLAAGLATLANQSFAIGSDVVTAVFSGSSTYAASTSNPVTITVTGTPTTTVLTSTSTAITTTQPVTLTATVSGAGGTPTGTVTFKSGNTVLTSTAAVNGSGVATYTVPAATLVVGPDAITATYSSDAIFSASTSNTVTITVTGTPSTTVLASSATAITTTQPVTLTATVTATSGTPTGAVAYFDGANQIPPTVTYPLNAGGVAVYTIPAGILSIGTHTITAKYLGDTNYSGSTANTVSITVSSTPSTIALTSSATSITPTQPVTLTATVSGTGGTPGGTVTFRSGSTILTSTAALAGGVATYTVPGGTLATAVDAITATYSGDNVFSTSSSNTVNITVAKVASVTLLAAPATALNTQTVTLTATESGSAGVPTGTVVFTDGLTQIGGVYTVTAGVATYTIPAGGLSLGTHSITATYSGDANYNASSSTSSITVTPPPVFTLAASTPAMPTFAAGGSTTSTVTVTSVSGPVPAVSLTCAVTLATSIPPTCSVGALGTLVAGGSATATVTVTTVAPHNLGGAQSSNTHTPANVTSITLAGLFLFGLPFAARRRSWRALACLFVLTGAFLGVTGCGGGGSTPLSGGTSVGAYTVTVTATAPNATTQTSTFTVTVQ